MPSFKKLISALCAAAMVCSSAAIPALADDDFSIMTATTVYEKDYTETGAENDWNVGSTGYITATVNSDCGLTLDATGSDKKPSASLTLDTAVTDSAIIEYDVQYCGRGDGDSTLVFGTSSSSAVIRVAFNKNYNATTCGGSVNGKTFSGIPMLTRTAEPVVNATSWSDFMHIKHLVNMDEKTVDTVITCNGTEYYNGSAAFSNSDAASIQYIGYSFGKYDAVSFKNMSISTLEVPSITAEAVDKIAAGESAKIATVTNAADSDVVIDSSNSDFICDITDGVVTVSVSDSVTELTAANITITAENDGVTVAKTITVTAVPLADFAKTIADSLALSGSSVTDNGDNNYSVSGGFTVPTELNGATITWAAEGDGVTVNGNSVAVDVEAGTAATLTATVDYKGVTEEKVFNLTLTAYQEYYNENFDSWAGGTLAQLKSTPHSDTTSYEGWEFYIGSRSDGGNGIISVSTSGTDKYISANADYGDSNRNPYIVLTNAPRAKDVTGALIANFKLRVGGSIPVTLSDGTSGSTSIGANQVTINLTSLGLNTGEWYDVTYAISTVGSSAALIIKNSDGDTVVTRSYASTLTTISRIDISYNARANVNADINNFSLYKTSKYTVPSIDTEDVDVVFAGNSQKVASVSDADTIKVELSDSENFSYTVSEDGAVTVTANDNAVSGAATTVTITATADAAVSAQTTITTLRADDIINADNEKASVINYAADKNGKLMTLTPADGAVIFNDIVFPTTSEVEVFGTTYTVDVVWAVTGGDSYLSSKGVINVDDTDEHSVKLTRTATYAGAEPSVKTYNMYVQFDPETVEAAVNAAAEEKEITGTDLDDYITAFVSDYQVKFDAALDDNFSDIPSSAKGGDSFDLPTEGVFGSTFTWSSSSSDTIKVANSTNKATVKTPNSTKTVTLTATVKAGGAKSKNHTESVRVTGSSSGGSSSGGSSRGSSGSSATSIATGVTPVITTPITGTTTINPNPSGFTDLGSVSWAVTAINNLYVNGVINGKTATEFYPNDAVTRAEFAKILVNAFNIPTVSADSATFYDVPASNWASSYVETAAANGIIKGYDDGSFEPNTNVSRQDMAVMVLRAAQASGYSFKEKREAASFNDASSIASYAKDAIETLYKAGVVNGVDGNAFEPLSTSTRAQACQIIYNVFN